MKKNARTAWTAAGILGFITIVLLAYVIMDWNQKRNDFGYVVDQATENIAEQRNEVREKCGADANSPACQDALLRMSDILDDVSKDFARFKAKGAAGATTTAPAQPR